MLSGQRIGLIRLFSRRWIRMGRHRGKVEKTGKQQVVAACELAGCVRIMTTGACLGYLEPAWQWALPGGCPAVETDREALIKLREDCRAYSERKGDHAPYKLVEGQIRSCLQRIEDNEIEAEWARYMGPGA